MIKSGVCSVTFRDKSVEEVIRLAVDAGLDGIEWGGDRHVPSGDIGNAVRVGEMTRAAGLSVVGYGSYYFAFDRPCDPPADCAPVVETAAALRAPVIRMWAGSMTVEKTAKYFDAVVEKSQLMASLAQDVSIKVAYEFHPNTFTETLAGTLDLLAAVAHPNLYTYWQPHHADGLVERLQQIAALKDRLLNLHVYHWDNPPDYCRASLSLGGALWPACLLAADESGTERHALIEFVKDNDPLQFLCDAAVLGEWLSPVCHQKAEKR